MKAILENGGIDISILTQVGDTLWFFNEILDVVCDCSDAEEASLAMTSLFLKRRNRLLKNPFTFGFCENGLEVWQDDNPNRVVFAPCETDIEI